MNFASDNTAPMAPAILDAIVKANSGFARGYGNDDWTAGVERRLADVFEREVAVFLVPTGTAANALALAQVTPPWGVVFCHAESHIATDECGAPEFFGGGLKLAGLPGGDGKIAPQTLQAALAGYGDHRPHQMVAAALSLTQASEAGTIYRTDEIAASERDRARPLARRAHGRRALRQCPGAAQHHAGADDLAIRHRRAVVRRHQGRRAGGGGRGGVRSGPRRVFRRTAQARRSSRCQNTASSPRKWRPISPTTAGFSWRATPTPWPTGWRRGSSRSALAPVWPVEANLIFVALPRALDLKLKAAGAGYYVRPSQNLDLGADQVLVRLVTSFATQEAEIERFVNLCKKI